jgi:hypothetical protein
MYANVALYTYQSSTHRVFFGLQHKFVKVMQFTSVFEALFKHASSTLWNICDCLHVNICIV